MSQPAVTITQIDGALGVLPPSSGKLLAILGVSSTGPIDVPATYARVRDVVAAYGVGPLVEAAAHFIERYGRPVVLVRTGQTTAGSVSAVTQTGTGTSVASVDAVNDEPDDDFEFFLRVVAGGTVGTAGITFQWSLDGGRTLSPVQALGTANSFVFPGSGGVEVDFAAGNLAVGDTITFRGFAPAPNATELGTALDALAASAVSWDIAHVVAPLDGTLFDTVDTKIAGLAAIGKYRAWMGNFRMPSLGETPAQYLAAFTTAFASKATIYGAVCAGACKLLSSVTRRNYRRPVSFVVAAREASVSQEVNTADVNLGPLVGVSVRDSLGNPDEHDESVNPGLDDARATVLRTWDGIEGVYINRSRCLAPAGSDFELFTYRRVMNLTLEVLRAYFLRRLNRPVRVDANTGFILESEALEIESGARAAMRAALLAAPKASGVQFSLSRTDNLLSTRTMTGQARVIPLAYPEVILLDVGFLNPALAVQTV